VERTSHVSAEALAQSPSHASTDRAAIEFALAQAATQRRTRAVLAKELHTLPLTWQQLHECPLWMAWPTASREALCALAGVGWLKLSLRACIDGRQLAPVAALVGSPVLSLALKTDTPMATQVLANAPKPLLPPPQSIAAYVVAWGRALLVWAFPHDCREVLAGHLAWTCEPALVHSIASHAEWAQAALQQAHTSAEASGVVPAQPSQKTHTTGQP
jgi:hypothetical protein